MKSKLKGTNNEWIEDGVFFVLCSSCEREFEETHYYADYLCKTDRDCEVCLKSGEPELEENDDG